MKNLTRIAGEITAAKSFGHLILFWAVIGTESRSMKPHQGSKS